LAVAETKEKTEPFDIAIVEGAERFPRGEIGISERLGELPFDPHTRKNAVLVRSASEIVMVVRGAPEEILRVSPSFQGQEREALTSWLSEKGRAGERTIAIAKRGMPPGTTGFTPADIQDLEFLGAIAFTDPIKPSTFHAVEMAREL